jgi:O-acetylserine/cysteine efflux transporter
MPLRDILLAIIATLVWGCNFIFIKWGVDEVPPLFLTVLRFVAVTIPAVFLIARPSSSYRTLALYGFVMGTLQFGFLNIAIKLGFSTSLASLVSQLQSFFTIALATVFLGERPKRTEIIGAAIAFVGIAVIAAARWTPQQLLPFAFSVLGSFFLGASNIISKHSGEERPFSFVIWSSIFATPPLLLLSLLLEDHQLIWSTLTAPSFHAMISVAYLAWGSTFVGYGLWNLLLQRHDATRVVPFYLLVPVFGIIVGVLVLGEAFTTATLWGSLLIFAGLLINVFGPRLKKA